MENLLTKIFTPKCYFCGEAGRYICYACESRLLLCESGVCIRCQEESMMGYTHRGCLNSGSRKLPSQLCSIYQYTGLAAEIIKKSKYNPKCFVLLKILSANGAKLASKLGFDFKGYTVVPIPISRQREKERGFNQTEIIAKAVCKEFSLIMDNSIITRKRDTGKQHSLHKAERKKNIQGAFTITDVHAIDKIRGGNFLIVDDICTTGSTLMEVTDLLLLQGANDARCFALSRKI